MCSLENSFDFEDTYDLRMEGKLTYPLIQTDENVTLSTLSETSLYVVRPTVDEQIQDTCEEDCGYRAAVTVVIFSEDHDSSHLVNKANKVLTKLNLRELKGDQVTNDREAVMLIARLQYLANKKMWREFRLTVLLAWNPESIPIPRCKEGKQGYVR